MQDGARVLSFSLPLILTTRHEWSGAGTPMSHVGTVSIRSVPAPRLTVAELNEDHVWQLDPQAHSPHWSGHTPTRDSTDSALSPGSDAPSTASLGGVSLVET